MRTRAKKKYVASDRARRKNVPRQILPYVRENFFIIQNIKEQMFENNLQNEWNCDMLITEKNKHMFGI